MSKSRESGPALRVHGTMRISEAKDVTTATFAGRWDVHAVIVAEKELRKIAPAAPGHKSVVDISAIDFLDTIGAMAVTKVRNRLGETGKAEIVGADPAQAALLDEVGQVGHQSLQKLPRKTLRDQVEMLGKWTVKLGLEARDLLGFFGELSATIFGIMLHPRRLRLTALVNQMQIVGIDAMPIVGLLAFLVGIVITFISGDQLQRFGAGIFIVNLLGIGVLRELGILITAIIVAGRSGSAFTAEIGTMKINQEVDAMLTIGLNPMEVLVVPRTLALMLMLIPLGFFANIIMIGGGALMANLTMGIAFTQFLTQFQSSVPVHNLWVGVLKTPFFAFVIAMVGCYHGLLVSGSAESVGQQTTASVVQSIFLVITVDAVFSVVFSEIGW